MTKPKNELLNVIQSGLMRKIKQTSGRNACLLQTGLPGSRPAGLNRAYSVKTNTEWGRCGTLNTAQHKADHLPGDRQERSGSANALERRSVAQPFHGRAGLA